MRFYEAIKLVEEGKKVRRVDWEKDEYIHKNTFNDLIDEKGEFFCNVCLDGDWEEYEEDKRFQLLREFAQWHVDNCTIDMEKSEDKGALKEEREHWLDVIRIIDGKETYIDWEWIRGRSE